MYTIGDVAKMFKLPISTIRYYDQQKLLLDLKRDSMGIRYFDEKDIEALRVIECLKKSGMQIKDIKQFMYWCSLGDQTIPERLEMFQKQKQNIETEIEELKKALNMINFKCWYYKYAKKEGLEALKKLKPEQFPKEIQKYYQESHK